MIKLFIGLTAISLLICSCNDNRYVSSQESNKSEILGQINEEKYNIDIYSQAPMKTCVKINITNSIPNAILQTNDAPQSNPATQNNYKTNNLGKLDTEKIYIDLKTLLTIKLKSKTENNAFTFNNSLPFTETCTIIKCSGRKILECNW